MAIQLTAANAQYLIATDDHNTDLMFNPGTDHAIYVLFRCDALTSGAEIAASQNADGDYIQWDVNTTTGTIHVKTNQAGGSSRERILKAVSVGDVFCVFWGYNSGSVGSEVHIGCATPTDSQLSSATIAQSPDAALEQLWLGRNFSDTATNPVTVLGVVATNSDVPSKDDAVAMVNGGNPKRDPTADISFTPDFVWSAENSLVPITGTEGFGCLVTPNFIDDSAISSNFTGWSQSGIADIADEPIYRGNVQAKSGRQFNLHCGDSFVTGYSTNALPQQITNEFARNAGVPLSAILWDCQKTGNAGAMVLTVDNAESVADDARTAGPTVGVISAGSNASLDGTEFLGMPLRQLEYDTGTTSAGANFINFLFRNSTIDDGPFTEWLGSATSLAVRLIHWTLGTDPIASVRLQDNDDDTVNRTSMDSTAGFNIADAFTLDDNTTDTERTLRIQPLGGSYPANKHLIVGGVIAQVSGAAGIGYGAFWGNSWSWSGFAANAAADDAADKHYSRAQVAPLMQGIVDLGMPIVIHWHNAPENLSESAYKTAVGNAIDDMDTLFASLGVSINHIVYDNHVANQGAADRSLYTCRQDAESLAMAVRELAQERDNVGHVSVYSYTLGAFNHGDNSATRIKRWGSNDANGPVQVALVALGLETTPGLDWLDANDLHLDVEATAKAVTTLFSSAAYSTAATSGGNYDLARGLSFDLARDLDDLLPYMDQKR